MNEENIFVTSDHHLGHKNILKLQSPTRGHFKTLTEMNEEYITLWNEKITTDAQVYYLGDFAFGGPGFIQGLVNRLNGKIHYILGNHDRTLKRKQTLHKLFIWVKDYFELKLPDKQLFVLCHYPFESWNKRSWGSIHLHGHSHGNLPTEIPNRLDVGVDSIGPTPLNLIEIKEILATKKENNIETKTN